MPATTEVHTSHVPALVMLAAMGWEILPQSECENLRGRTSRVCGGAGGGGRASGAVAAAAIAIG